MLRSNWNYTLLTALTATALMACGDDKGTTDGSTSNPTNPTDAVTDPGTAGTDPTDAAVTDGETDGTATEATPTTTMTGDTAADGEACSANGDCASQGCLKYRDLEQGECVAAPAGGNTRFTGTVIDFATGMPIPNAELRVLGALSALGDPATAEPVLTANADASGQIDTVSVTPIAQGIGIIGIILGGDYFTSATGLASPIMADKYGPMNGNRDIWAVPSAKLTEWSGFLMADAEIAESLPLGEKGGVIGLVRDGTGAPKAGAKVISKTNGDATGAKVRYLADDGASFTSDVTGTSGVFVLTGPALAEKFTVDGGVSEGTAGSANKAVFVMILTEP